MMAGRSDRRRGCEIKVVYYDAGQSGAGRLGLVQFGGVVGAYKWQVKSGMTSFSVTENTASEISAFIEEAIVELDVQHVSGQDVTPFLLKRIVERTAGRSLVANLALVRNNAATAAAIAVEYAKLQG